MTAPKRQPASAAQTEPVEEKAVSGSDAGAAALQALADDATSKGYFGNTPDPIPNERYSLASGPDAPSAAEQLAAVKPTTNKKEG